MPELPEVETLVRGLRKRIIGNIIRDIDIRYQKSFIVEPKLVKKYIIGAQVTNIWRYQKMIVIDLSSGWSLVIHLKMTGQLVFVKNPKLGFLNSKQVLKSKLQIPKNLEIRNSKLEIRKQSLIGGHPQKSYFEHNLPHRYTRVIFYFQSTDSRTQVANDGFLFFNDLRKFGWIKALPRGQKTGNRRRSKALSGGAQIINLESFLQSLDYSADPLSKEWKLEDFENNIKTRKTKIFQVISDQKVASGVGNIYANEALFCAKISPLRQSHTLTKKEIKRLYQCIKDVFREGIKHGGTTFSDYRDIDGAMGQMYKNLKIYDREGEQCYHCSGIIKRIKIGGRSAYYCACQK